jgi:hypothetical protein
MPPHPVRPTPPQPVQPVALPSTGEFATVNQLRYMERLIDEIGVDVHDLLSYFGYESLDRVPKGDVDRVLRAIQSKRRAA